RTSAPVSGRKSSWTGSGRSGLGLHGAVIDLRAWCAAASATSPPASATAATGAAQAARCADHAAFDGLVDGVRHVDAASSGEGCANTGADSVRAGQMRLALHHF